MKPWVNRMAGHRGVRSLAPENTLSSFKKAIELGLNWVETDTQLSADEVPVVIHDKTVDRCSNGWGSVRYLSVNQIQQLDAGSWFSSEFKHQQIPTLEQVLTLCKTHHLHINLELKYYYDKDISLLCQRVKEIIHKIDFPENELIFSSFSHKIMLEIKEVLPHIRRGQLYDKIPTNWEQELQEIQAYSLHCNYKYLDQKIAQAIKDAGYILMIYTPNNAKSVKPMWDWGVDMIISDSPQHFK